MIVPRGIEGRIIELSGSDSTTLAQSWLDPAVSSQEIPFNIQTCDSIGAGSFHDHSFALGQDLNRATSNLSNVLVPSASFDLADLNSKLVEHHANLALVINVPPPSALAPKVIAIDQTFALTRRFIHVNKTFSIRTADQPTVFLFMSCYYRLVDIYQSIFEKMELCTHEPHAIIPKGIMLKMLSTQVGSYSTSDLWRNIESVEAPMTDYSTHFMLLLLLCTNTCEEPRDAVYAGWKQNSVDNSTWKSSNAALAHELMHSSVRMIEPSGDKIHFLQSVQDALWNKWAELSTQIQTTERAAMVFAVACL